MPHYLTSYALIIMIICFPKATQLKSRIILFALVLIAGFVYASVRQVYSVKSSKVIFKSVAELETITAESTTLTGLVDPTNKNFAFSISKKSFDGFNSSCIWNVWPSTQVGKITLGVECNITIL